MDAPRARGKPPRKPNRETQGRSRSLVSLVEGYGGPAQPAPTIIQCLNGGVVWLEVECNRCKSRACLPMDAIRRQPTADLEA